MTSSLDRRGTAGRRGCPGCGARGIVRLARHPAGAVLLCGVCGRMRMRTTDTICMSDLPVQPSPADEPSVPRLRIVR